MAGRCLSAVASGRKCTADVKPSVPRFHFSTSKLPGLRANEIAYNQHLAIVSELFTGEL